MAMTETTADVARTFATLTARKREIQQTMKALQTELDAAEKNLLDKIVEEGVAKISVDTEYDGTWTVSASTLAWARLRDGTQKKAMAILKEEGMETLLTINSTKLSGMYREDVEARDHGGEVLPDAMLKLLDVTERTKVSARKV